MANGDFDLFPRDDESREQLTQRFEDAALAEDGHLRFQANGAEFRALGAELADETDPDRIIDLTEQRGASIFRGLGSGVLSLWQKDTLAERQRPETDSNQDGRERLLSE